MRNNRIHIFHPATLFFILTVGVVLCSWIFEIYGIEIIQPHTGEEIRVQSILSPEGIRWLLRHIVTNFTGFAPLGMVIVTMFGIGVAEHSGFISACIRKGHSRGKNLSTRVIIWVIILGLLSNVIGDAGYIILLPIAASLFRAAGLHPVAGIITAYVSVACGYSANIVISTMDPLLARTTEEASITANISYNNVGSLSNYYFMFASTILIGIIIYIVARKIVFRRIGPYTDTDAGEFSKPLSHKEKRALYIAITAGIIYFALILLSTFSSFGILRGVGGNLMRSPFIMGILFLLSLGAGIMGMIYGFSSGRYRSDINIIQGLSHSTHLLGVYFVIAFFAAQMFACLSYSHLDICLAVWIADLLAVANLNALPMLLSFILLSALINLIMVSATGKWGFMAFIFLPIFADLGISPEIVQCAFRIGDSSSNAITPFLFYMPLALTYMLHYQKQTTYYSLLRYTWPFAIAIFAGWVLLFILWYICGIPFGL